MSCRRVTCWNKILTDHPFIFERRLNGGWTDGIVLSVTATRCNIQRFLWAGKNNSLYNHSTFIINCWWYWSVFILSRYLSLRLSSLLKQNFNWPSANSWCSSFVFPNVLSFRESRVMKLIVALDRFRYIGFTVLLPQYDSLEYHLEFLYRCWPKRWKQ